MNLVGFSPDAIEGGSGEGRGLCQWSFGRREALENFAISRGKEWSDENIQVEFLIGELTKSGGADGYATYQLQNTESYYNSQLACPEAWINAKNYADATRAFCYSFERPDKTMLNMEKRLEAAEKYYKQFAGKTNASNDKWLKGSITLNGKTFYIYNQNLDNSYESSLELQDWKLRCGRAASICITSGYAVPSKTTALGLMQKIDDYTELSPSTSWFSSYDLTLKKIKAGNTGEWNYTSQLRTILSSGSHAMIYVRGANNENVNYGGTGVSGITGKGMSGKEWTTEWHWMAILAYRNNNGVEEMYIANSTGTESGWYGLNEFLVDGGKEVSALYSITPNK